MDARTVFTELTTALGDGVFGFQAAAPPSEKEGPREALFRVAPSHLLDVATRLRDDFGFEFLQNLTAVDWIKSHSIEVVYHLHSYRHRSEVVWKVSVPRDRPRLPSIAGVWNNANWLEREQYDLLGVVFEGHPDLRRLLMPDDWVGHPMRKDYREAAEYHGMPTTRISAFDLLTQYDRAGSADAASTADAVATAGTAAKAPS